MICAICGQNLSCTQPCLESMREQDENTPLLQTSNIDFPTKISITVGALQSDLTMYEVCINASLRYRLNHGPLSLFLCTWMILCFEKWKFCIGVHVQVHKSSLYQMP